MKRIISMDDSISPPHFTKNNKFNNSKKKNIDTFIQKDLPVETIHPIGLLTKTQFPNRIKIPDLRGLSMRKAMSSLHSIGILFEMIGSGKVTRQTPRPGTLADKNTICIVELK